MSNFLNWVADRFVNVYGESPNVDFVLKLRELARQPLADSFVAKPVAGELPPLPAYGWVLPSSIKDAFEKGAENPWMESAGAFPVFRSSQPVQQPAAVGDQCDGCEGDCESCPYDTARVPAAGVQGDADKMACINCHSSKTPGKAKCAECGHDRFAQRPITYPASQPDSGRDAALSEGVELTEHKAVIRPSKIQLTDGPKTSKWLMYEPKKEVCDGGDWVRYWSCESHTYRTGRVSAEDCELIEATILSFLAAHPANGAQAGLSDIAEALEFAAQVVELFDDAKMQADYMIDAGEAAGIIRALPGYLAAPLKKEG